MILNLRVLGLEHFLLITFSAELCRTLAAIIPDLGGCVWTSLPIARLGGAFEMWTMRKHYLGVMAGACMTSKAAPKHTSLWVSTAAAARVPRTRTHARRSGHSRQRTASLLILWSLSRG
jgi:hypothetical protein